jgi:hypothetical protein
MIGQASRTRYTGKALYGGVLQCMEGQRPLHKIHAIEYEILFHRVSALRNRGGSIVGLTLRVGRALTGVAHMVEDLVSTGQSFLVLGEPGSGDSFSNDGNPLSMYIHAHLCTLPTLLSCRPM